MKLDRWPARENRRSGAYALRWREIMGEKRDLPFSPYFEDLLDAEQVLDEASAPWGDDSEVIEEWFAAGECLDYDEIDLTELDESQAQPLARVWGWVRALPVRPPRRRLDAKA